MNFTEAYIAQHTNLIKAIETAITSLFSHLKQTHQNEEIQAWCEAQSDALNHFLNQLAQKPSPESVNTHIDAFLADANAALSQEIALLKSLFLKYAYAQQLLSLPATYSAIDASKLATMTLDIQKYNQAIDKTTCETIHKNIATLNSKIDAIKANKTKNKQTLLNQSKRNEAKISNLQTTLKVSKTNLANWDNPTIKSSALSQLFDETNQFVDLTDSNIETLEAHLQALTKLQGELSTELSAISTPPNQPANDGVYAMQENASTLQRELADTVANMLGLNGDEEAVFDQYQAEVDKLSQAVFRVRAQLEAKDVALSNIERQENFKMKDRVIEAYSELLRAFLATAISFEAPRNSPTSLSEEPGFLARFLPKTPKPNADIPSSLETLTNAIQKIREFHPNILSYPDSWFNSNVMQEPTPWGAMPESRGQIQDDYQSLNNMISAKTTHSKTRDTLLKARLEPQGNPLLGSQNTLDTLVAEINQHVVDYNNQVGRYRTAQAQLTYLQQRLQERMTSTQIAIDGLQVADENLNNQIEAQLSFLNTFNETIKSNNKNISPDEKAKLERKQKRVNHLRNNHSAFSPEKIEARLQAIKRKNIKNNLANIPALHKDLADEIAWYERLVAYSNNELNTPMISRKSLSLTTMGDSRKKSMLKGFGIGAAIAVIAIIATLCAFFTGGIGAAVAIPLLVLAAATPLVSTYIGRKVWNARERSHQQPPVNTPAIQTGRNSPYSMAELQQPSSTPSAGQGRSERVERDHSFSSSTSRSGSIEETNSKDRLESDTPSPSLRLSGSC